MPRRRNKGSEDLRRLLAAEAARIMTDQGIRDYRQAKTKAAQRLGVRNDAELPKNTEIERALKERLVLFQGEDHREHLDHLRRAAVEAMRYLDEFSPRLVGPVLDGTADQHSAVCLHVFADTPEHFTLFLDDRGIPYELHERRLRIDRERTETFPACLFAAGEVPMDVTVLPHKVLRQAPISPVNGRPMQRASLHRLKQMLEESEILSPF